MGNKKNKSGAKKKTETTESGSPTSPSSPSTMASSPIFSIPVSPSSPPPDQRSTPSTSSPSGMPASPMMNNDSSQGNGKSASSDEAHDNIQQALRFKEEGNKYFKQKKYKESIVFYGKAMEKDPAQSTYPSNRSAAYIQLKQFRNALNDVQLACTLQGEGNEDAKVLVRLARCQLALGLIGPCSSTLDNLSRRTSIPAHDPIHAQIKSTRENVNKVQTCLATFEKAKREANYSLARLSLDQLTKSIEADPGEVPVEWRLEGIRLSILSSKWDAAHTTANESLRLHPQNPEVLVERGRLLFLTGKLSQALQHVTTALKMDPSHVAARELRKQVKSTEQFKEEGNALFKSAKFSEALEKYNLALEAIGSAQEHALGGHIRATLLSNKATTELKLNKPQEALESITTSLELLPTSFKALRTRGRIYISLAQSENVSEKESVEYWEKGVAELKQALEHGDAEADIRALKSEIRKAEVDLKRAKTKDYYKILGVKKECTQVEIKKAYRVASLRHHPDKGGDEEQFKLVSEAYAVLSDEQKRARYDNGEDEEGGGFGEGMSGADLSDLFAQFHSFGGHGGGRGSPFGAGGGRGGPRFHFSSAAGGSPFGF